MTAIIHALVALALSVAAGVQATQPAARVAETVGPPATTVIDAYQPSGHCTEWAETAFAVGWPTDQWPSISRVMWCESKCQPGAHNQSGASGLMQIMPGWWDGRDPYDPATNLTMALEVHDRQGWRAWSCY